MVIKRTGAPEGAEVGLRGVPVISALTSEEALKFRTFSNYVQALNGLFCDEFGDSARMVTSLLWAPLTQTACLGVVDLERIAISLTRAWATERLMSIPFARPEMEEIAPTAALWLPVQSYYAVYSGLEGALIAHGQSSTTHTKSLNRFAQELQSKCPTPLSSACSGFVPTFAYDRFKHQPSDQYSNLKTAQSPEERWTLLGTALRTTRVKILRDKMDKRKAECRAKKKPFPRTERAQIIAREPPTTIPHFLYRLRLRSNYGDSEVFISGSTRYESRVFGKAYVDLADFVLGVFEVLIERRLGIGTIAGLAGEFLRKGGNYDDSVAKRWSIS